MEEFTKIVYKGKDIFYIDYSKFGFDVGKALKLIRFATEEYKRLQLPPKSVLAIVNVNGLHFDTELINAFKEEKENTAYYEKKVAIVGMKGLQKVAYNFVVTLTQRNAVKVFDEISDAKDWLVSD